MKRKIIIISAIALIGILIGFRLVANKSKIDSKNKMPENKNVSIPVTVATVSAGSTDQQLVRTGNLIPYKEAQNNYINSMLSYYQAKLGIEQSQGSLLGFYSELP